jgi:hypothetical protein
MIQPWHYPLNMPLSGSLAFEQSGSGGFNGR